jgi:hypothetical protein
MNRISLDVIVGIFLVPLFHLFFWLFAVVILPVIDRDASDSLFQWDHIFNALAIGQIFYLIPAALYCHRKGRVETAKGIAIGAALITLIMGLYPYSYVLGGIVIIACLIWVSSPYLSTFHEQRQPSDASQISLPTARLSRDLIGGAALIILLHLALFPLGFLTIIFSSILWPSHDSSVYHGFVHDKPLDFAGALMIIFIYLIKGVGLTQLLYVTPSMLYFQWRGRFEVVKGIFLAALTTVLLTAISFIESITGMASMIQMNPWMIVVPIFLLICTTIVFPLGLYSFKRRS